MKFRRTGKLSDDIEDRRGSPGRRGVAIGGGGLSIGAILFVLLTQVFGGGGGDLGTVLGELAGPAAQPAEQGEAIEAGGAATSEQDEFISFVLDDVQDFWAEQFSTSGRSYERARLVLYTSGTDTAGCGFGQAAFGPFYCPADNRVYVDLTFFDQLASRFGAPGDFAQAYVLAHEIAHHVQNETGISAQVRSQQQADADRANDLSVRLELQADCLSGVWAYSAFDADLLEEGDLEEGLQAASAVGDDAIQSGSGAPVNPETWTHGSSEQRVSWFRRGFDTGDANACDTFSGDI
ncbi:MAG TPA: neutral zinc metallopeptidase [Euzebya sp.]|nr:neutral zinc metallopeptidase [Euzebya sp.]